MRHILILGGTTEARALAARFTARPDLRVTLSLAGRTSAPAPQSGNLRSGGFGGADGLADWLTAQSVDTLIDATHPFARRITAHAAIAAQRTGTPLLTLSRPPWPRQPDDLWTEVATMAEAAAALGPAPSRVFLAIGRQEVAAFRAAPHHAYLIRSIDPAPDLPGATRILARGPFAEPDEIRLLTENRIDILVAKNSGGPATYAKISAARVLRLPVILIQRTANPDALTTIPEIESALLHPANRGV